jgi:hypothetical protein
MKSCLTAAVHTLGIERDRRETRVTQSGSLSRYGDDNVDVGRPVCACRRARAIWAGVSTLIIPGAEQAIAIRFRVLSHGSCPSVSE